MERGGETEKREKREREGNGERRNNTAHGVGERKEG